MWEEEEKKKDRFDPGFGRGSKIDGEWGETWG